MQRFSIDPPIPLSPQHKLFAEAYVLEKQGSKAARAAGYSVKSARVQAHRLLRREPIRAYINALKNALEVQRAEVASRPEVTPEWIRDRYCSIASVSAADFVTPDDAGRLRWKRPDELTADQRVAVAEIKTERRGRKVNDEGGLKIAGYKLHSSKDATDSLARIQGMGRETVTHHHAVDVRAVFELAARSADTSETAARLRAKYGNAGARVVDEPPHSHTSPVPLKRW
jgi:Terminase small subunit